MKSAVVRWTSWTPTANSAAPGNSAVQGESSCGSSRSAASQTAKKPKKDATVTSSPTSPYSARARAAAPKISAHAATTARSKSAAWSGRRYRPTLPRHAMLWTARIARAADVPAGAGRQLRGLGDRGEQRLADARRLPGLLRHRPIDRRGVAEHDGDEE